ncbi:MAG: ECF RNA polymerase sigma factor SigK [Acidimicrobiales bacterium]|nr:ECF RNA polymerase sigma factor SigK [Acidimicrobiales bacterium]
MSTVNPLRRNRLKPVPDVAAGDPADPAAALLARAARGDEAAFAELYDELSPMVHGVILAVVRDPGYAEEVTQEVFVELWRVAARHRPDRGSVRSWASTIAHRRAVDRVRSEQAARNRHDRVGREAVIEDGDDAAAVVTTRLEHERVRRALDELTPLQREAVHLAYYGANTYREVAALLDVPEGTVKTRIRDGLIRLRDHLGAPT